MGHHTEISMQAYQGVHNNKNCEMTKIKMEGGTFSHDGSFYNFGGETIQFGEVRSI